MSYDEKKDIKIGGTEIDLLVEICKRDRTAPIFIELELNKLLDVSRDLASWIKLKKIQRFVIENRNIRKDEEINDYYNKIIKTLDIIGESKRGSEIKKASKTLRYFLEKLKDEKVAV